MMLLDRAAIFAASDTTYEEVACPEWGGSVRVKALTAAERDDYEASLLTGKGKNRELNLRNARAKLVARTVVDDTGKRLFSDGDAEALGDKSAAVMQRLFETAQRLSGLSDDDVEELTEGFASGQSDASSSG